MRDKGLFDLFSKLNLPLVNCKKNAYKVAIDSLSLSFTMGVSLLENTVTWK